jgi:hypothetical protein
VRNSKLRHDSNKKPDFYDSTKVQWCAEVLGQRLFCWKPWFSPIYATPSFKPDFHLDEINKIVNFDVFEFQIG